MSESSWVRCSFDIPYARLAYRGDIADPSEDAVRLLVEGEALLRPNVSRIMLPNPVTLATDLRDVAIIQLHVDMHTARPILCVSKHMPASYGIQGRPSCDTCTERGAHSTGWLAMCCREPGLPVSPRYFPDLYHGEGGLTTTYTPYELGLARGMCMALNKLTANTIPDQLLPEYVHICHV